MAEDYLSSDNAEKIARILLRWFRRHKRDLPWRRSYDPYHVWISEIMLQQTQMERGVRYFHNWVKRFPDVVAVAQADEEEILQHWEGLGYYARARNLHRAAKKMVTEFQGQVPSDYSSLLRLPGIGPYTAAAVSSIAGNQDVPVIDTNVNRIFARLFNIQEPIKESGAQKTIQEIAGKLLPKGKARLFNQALMDLGGVICTPKNPDCGLCPLSDRCRSQQLGIVAERPVLAKKKQPVFINRVVGVIVHRDRVYMQKRAHTSLWTGLWEFPGGERQVEQQKTASLDVASEVHKETGLVVRAERFLACVHHQFTHHKITVDAYLCSIADDAEVHPRPRLASNFRWLQPRELDDLACPSGVRKVIDHLKKTYPAMFATKAP